MVRKGPAHTVGMDSTASPREARAFDAAMFGLAAVGTFAVGLEAAAFGRIERLFADFGGALPELTEFVLRTHLPLVALVVCIALEAGAALAMRTKDYRPEGRAFLVAAAVLAWCSVLLGVLAALLPLRTLDAAIK